jgi:flagellar motor switch protein FliM
MTPNAKSSTQTVRVPGTDRAAGSIFAAPSQTVAVWDARQSGQIGREPMRAITLLHESFARNLTHALGAYLRIVFEAALESAQHLYYRDFLQRLPEVTYLSSCKLVPIDTPALLQLDLSIAFPLIDLLLGGEGKGKLEPRNVTEIEEQILESVVQIICRELGGAWQALGLEFRFDRRQEGANALRLMPPDDKVLALSFAVTMPETRGTLNLAVPASVSTALLRKMTADWAYRRPSGPTESKEQVKARLLRCPFPIELTLLDVKVPAGELFQLQPGKLLVLEHEVESPVTLVAGEQPLFEASLMRYLRKRVARLSGRAPKPKSDGKRLS